MKPNYIQFNCREENGIDLKQARAVVKHNPDIIILEYPNNKKTPSFPFNEYEPLEKPKEMVKERLKGFSKKVLKIHPWAEADVIMWGNIVNLWKKNHQVLVYSVDAPSELTSQWLDVWRYTYPLSKKCWVWWVQIYLREKTMTKNIQWILNNYKSKKNPTTLIFLQSFHWNNVKFLLKNPSKEEIWNYYFGNFKEVNKSDITLKIKKLNVVFYKYWKKISDFYLPIKNNL